MILLITTENHFLFWVTDQIWRHAITGDYQLMLQNILKVQTSFLSLMFLPILQFTNVCVSHLKTLLESSHSATLGSWLTLQWFPHTTWFLQHLWTRESQRSSHRNLIRKWNGLLRVQRRSCGIIRKVRLEFPSLVLSSLRCRTQFIEHFQNMRSTLTKNSCLQPAEDLSIIQRAVKYWGW